MEGETEKIHLISRLKEDRQPSKGRQLTVLMACMYMHFMSLGFTVSLGVIYVELIRYFDTQRSLAALVQSLYQGLTNLGGLFFAGTIHSHGVGKATILASISGAVSLFVSSFSVNIYMVIILIGLFGGLAMSVNYLSAFIAVGWTFTKHRRTALALLTMATAVGQTALPNIVEFIISEYGWSGAIIIASGLVLNSLPCGLILYSSESFFSKHKHVGETEKLPFCTCQSRVDVAFTLFMVVCAVFPGTGAVESWFIVDLTDLRGYGRQAGTVLLSLVGLFGLIGRMGGTLLLKIRPSTRAAIPLGVSFAFFALGHFTVIYFVKYSNMLAGVIFRGISVGFIMCIQPGMLLELKGIDRFPKAVALSNFLSGSVQIACGYMGGYIADLTGGYEIAFYIATVVAVGCSACLFIIQALLYRVNQTIRSLEA